MVAVAFEGPYLSVMPQNTSGADATVHVPSMLDLVRLSSRLLFPPGGAELYRHIALLTDMKAGDEVLVVACGKGVTARVLRAGVSGSRVRGRRRIRTWSTSPRPGPRDAGLGTSLQFQAGAADSLPYRDGIFDVAVGELGMAAHVDPADAVRELVRVTKPGGAVVLVQLSCRAPVDEARRQVLSEHLGARPMMAVEWKRFLKSAGVEDVFTEDWSDEETAGAGGQAVLRFHRDLLVVGESRHLASGLATVGPARRTHGALPGGRGAPAAQARAAAPPGPPHRAKEDRRSGGGRGPGGRDRAPCRNRERRVTATSSKKTRTSRGLRTPATRSGRETAGLPLFGHDEEGDG